MLTNEFFNPITRTWKTNPEYREILKLDKMLDKAGIPHTLDACNDGWRVCYPTSDMLDFVMDAHEHFGSYGSWMDKLEISGLLTPHEDQLDFVAGFLDAEDVFNRISEHWAKICDEYEFYEFETESDEEYMTPEEFTDELIRIRNEYPNDRNVAYREMQDLMCNLLINLGYGEGIDIFLNLFSEVEDNV